ncbi:hypothetical protein M8332_06095 [Fructilactobacillus ixorae]|uniref:Uncharacterized protein n=1 Tax=Fructilactobacillus ixorae TaxID=1750535 RepID=A0ABY5C5Q1_9LACO|nr:hypothetical protein [Fructilactobacillus ixorae]USS93163.1 hypothetical protein M8332_06095 [Fructilactobacillus ixorae]
MTYLFEHGLTGSRSMVVLATLFVTLLVVVIYWWSRQGSDPHRRQVAKLVGRTGSIIKRVMNLFPFK